MGANVVSTAGDATLTVDRSVDDGSGPSGQRGVLAGGAAAGQGVERRGAGGDYAALPASVLAYSGPVSNDAVTLGFRQAIGANEPLRTGTYGKTLTFTLSTTNP